MSPAVDTTEKQTKEIQVPRILYERIAQDTVAFLPWYITDTLKDSILDSHPVPSIYLRKLEQGTSITDIKPDSLELTKAQRTAFEYYFGVYILNEIATQTLTLEVSERLGLLKDRIYTSQPELYLEHFLEYFDGDTFVGLIEQLQIAMLSGDNSNLNDYVHEQFGAPDLTTFAVSIGKHLLADQVDEKILSMLESKRTAGGIKVSEPEKILIDSNRLSSLIDLALLATLSTTMFSFFAKEAFQSESQISLIIDTLGAIICFIVAVPTDVAVLASWKQTINQQKLDLIHELIHYYSFDLNGTRRGLIYPPTKKKQ